MKSKHWLVLTLVAAVAVVAWLVASGDTPAPREPAPAQPADAEPAPRRTQRAPQRSGEPPEPVPEEPAAEDPAPEEEAVTVLRVLVRARESAAPIERARVVVEDGGARREVFTDEEGVARFEPAPAADSDVAAHAPGRVRDFGWVAEAAPGEPAEITFSLTRGERLAGRVLDAEGRPLPGVPVELDEGGTLGGMSSSSGGPLLGTATTDVDGAFAFDGVPASELVTLFVTHHRFAQFARTVRLAGGGGDPPVEIRLQRGGSVTGTVRGPDLQPVAGARVLVAASDSDHLLDNPDGNVISSSASQLRALSGVSGDDGRFEVHGLLPGAAYIALATAPGIGRSDRHADLVVRAAGETIVVDLGLRRSSSLIIRVVDASGRPVDAAEVTCFSGAFSFLRPKSVDGAFRLGDLEPGEVTIDVDADGYVKERITHAVDGDDELTVTLVRGLSISGVAVNDLGRPLPDARIRAMRPMGDVYRDLPDSGADTKTDDEGRFEVGGLRDGAHTILCWAAGHDRGVLEPVTAGAREVRVVSRRHARITIEFVVPDGDATPKKVMWTTRRAGGGSGSELDWPEGGRLEQTLPPIPIELILGVEGYAEVAFALELDPGAERDLGRVMLGPGETVTGRVVDGEGNGIQGAEVSATPSWSFLGVVATTAADGGFSITHLAATDYEVEVQAAGFLAASFQRNPSKDRTWNVTLARGGLVTGFVRGADGVGISTGYVGVRGLGGEDAEDRTEFTDPDNSGRYAVRVQPGRYRVEYQPEGGDPVVGREIDLAEGDSVTIDFDLPR